MRSIREVIMPKSSLVVVLLVLTAFCSAAMWTGTFQFSPNSIHLTKISRDGATFQLVTVGYDPSVHNSGLAVCYSNEPGKPQLPFWTLTLVIPQGSRVAKLDVVPGPSADILCQEMVWPAQPMVPVSRSEPLPFVPPDPSVYGSSEAWPAELGQIGPVGTKSGFRLVTVNLYPVRYHPVEQRLTVFQSLKVTVSYEADPDAQQERLTKRQVQLFSQGVRMLVANPEDVDRYAPAVRSADFGTYDYVIITNSTLEPAFQPLVNWRTRKGYSTIVRTTSWINSNYSGRDLQEKIRNFIRDYYQNQGTMWVLLGGDHSIVPSRQARTYCSGETGNIPCDLYYADIQWSWDGDNDNIFGEYGQDTTDLYYDLYIGRASVDDTSQVRIFVNKVLTHEQNPPTDYLRRILLVDAFLWTGYNEDQSNDSIENITPSGWSDVRIHDPGNTTMVRDSLNHGFQFCHMVGHGNDVGIYHNSTAYYSNSVISGHNNGSRVGLINSIACYPGNYEYSDCLAENSHNCGTGGAHSVIMNSRYGWGPGPGPNPPGPSEKLDIRFYDFFFNHDTMPIGLTHAVSKEVYRNVANAGDGAWRWCYFELNLFGDPLLLMYENIPTPLTASFPNPITVGNQNFTVTVRASGNPVPNALVCLQKGSEVYTRGFTNSSGQITFTINPTTPGYMFVTATANNYLPAIDSCQVVSAINRDVGCYRIVTPVGTIDSGTVITPRGMVRNYTSVAVNNVQVRFTIGSGYSNTQTIPSLGPNDSIQVSFANWTASPGGNLATKCSTIVTSDTNPANDYSTGTVFVRRRDVGAVSISVSSPVDSGTTVPIVATVRNYGNTLETFDCRVTISGTSYNQTRSKTLVAGAQDTVLFPSWLAVERGAHTVACSTMLAGDMNQSNNRTTASVMVNVRDVACTGIISPSGPFDSTGTKPVQAWVRNYGTVTEDFQVLFRITGPVNWSNTAVVSGLGPGDSVVVNFANWPVGPRGNYTTACSTMLVPDQRRSNDKATGSFMVRVHDVAVLAIASPGSTVDSATTVPFRAVVGNLGSSLELVKVVAWVGSQYYDSLTVSLPPGVIDTVVLDPWSVQSRRGTYPVVCSTWVAGDIVPRNNVISTTTTVLVHDVGTTAIVAPIGDVDSGTVVVPQARVRNYGSVTETFNTRFDISDGYTASRLIMLNPGSESLLSFAPWTARFPGTFVTRCTTLLLADANHANDRQSGSVRVIGADVGVVAIVAPAAQIDPGPVIPIARVGNFSSSSQSFDVFLRITTVSGTPVYAESRLVTGLPPDSTRDVPFPSWNAAAGQYLVRCSTGFLDPNPRNDTLSSPCLVATHDVGIAAIVSPATVIRPMTVTPILRLINYGNVRETFLVTMAIEDTLTGSLVYLDSATVTNLGIGETRDQRLPPWSAATGYYRVTSWTGLQLDINRANDTLTTPVKVTPGALGWQQRENLPTGVAPVKHGACLAGLATEVARIYALKGNKTNEFYEYNLATGSWRTLPSVPLGPSGRPVAKSGSICSDGERFLYATKGNRTYEFWRYDALYGSWDQLADVPTGVKPLRGGTGLAFLARGDSSFIYCLKASGTFEFYAYSVEARKWETKASAPSGPDGKKFKAGSALCADSNLVFALKSATNEFYSYDPATDKWSQRPSFPQYSLSGKRVRCKDGCSMAPDGKGLIYAFSGGNREYFFAFNRNTGEWGELPSIPLGSSGRKVKAGGSLTALNKMVWALKGNGTYEFWVYIPDTMNLMAPGRPERHGVASSPDAVPAKVPVTLQPNPACDVVTVSLGAKPNFRDQSPVLMELAEPTGRVVRRLSLIPGTAADIDLRDLPAGTYFIRLKTPEFVRTEKLVVQR
ncbi:MAG: C25 family cysteine peptidase [candidate division WOR-3 bacterium]